MPLWLFKYSTILSSISFPATLIELLATIPPSEITATSVVPPPMSTIIFPIGSFTFIPAPIAAAIGSWIKYTSLAFACKKASSMALLSTSVIPDGTPTTTLGFPALYFWQTFLSIFLSIKPVAVKSAITPSCIGLTALIFSGVLPSISLASLPVATISPVTLSKATTDGSLKTIPFPFKAIKIFAVPRSIPISFELKFNKSRFIAKNSFLVCFI